MRKFDQRRLEIVDCAAHLFAAKGYDATGIAELSDAVGVGRGTLYHYIGSKEEILAEIHYRAITPLLVLGREVRDLDESGAVRLRLLSEVFFEVQYRLLEHSRVVMYESRRLTGAGREGYISTQREFQDMVRRILRDGEKDGSLRYDDLFLASMAFLNLHAGTLRWLDPAGPLSPSQLSAGLCGVLFEGIAAGDRAEVERAVKRRQRDLVRWRDPANWGVIDMTQARR